MLFAGGKASGQSRELHNNVQRRLIRIHRYTFSCLISLSHEQWGLCWGLHSQQETPRGSWIYQSCHHDGENCNVDLSPSLVRNLSMKPNCKPRRHVYWFRCTNLWPYSNFQHHLTPWLLLRLSCGSVACQHQQGVFFERCLPTLRTRNSWDSPDEVIKNKDTRKWVIGEYRRWIQFWLLFCMSKCESSISIFLKKKKKRLPQLMAWRWESYLLTLICHTEASVQIIFISDPRFCCTPATLMWRCCKMPLHYFPDAAWLEIQ